MNQKLVEFELIGKLVADWHLNVHERRSLPGGRAKASLILDAIVQQLCDHGSYPAGATPESDFHGGLIVKTLQGSYRILWKTQISFSQYESNWSAQDQTFREATETLMRCLFGDEIDGIPIDWQA